MRLYNTYFSLAFKSVFLHHYLITRCFHNCGIFFSVVTKLVWIWMQIGASQTLSLKDGIARMRWTCVVSRFPRVECILVESFIKEFARDSFFEKEEKIFEMIQNLLSISIHKDRSFTCTCHLEMKVIDDPSIFPTLSSPLIN